MKILILGANGMFGSMVFKRLSINNSNDVLGTVREKTAENEKIISSVDVLNKPVLQGVIDDFKPAVVINCTGLIKQRPEASDALKIFPINALFPHQLAIVCKKAGARLIQFSTDCIFSGKEGNYPDDAKIGVSDFYGLSKFVGEVGDLDHVLTLRTSIIGHELHSNYQLIDWFLAQQGSVSGYQKAIFSGFPTVEIATILDRHVLPNSSLHGLYNLSADAISKYDLLKIVKDVYNKDIEITPDDKVEIDRSLNSIRFRTKTGYNPPKWPELVVAMHQYQ